MLVRNRYEEGDASVGRHLFKGVIFWFCVLTRQTSSEKMSLLIINN